MTMGMLNFICGETTSLSPFGQSGSEVLDIGARHTEAHAENSMDGTLVSVSGICRNLRRLGHAAVLTLLALTVNSCASFFLPEYDVSDISVQKKDNGYLILLAVNRDIRDVSAFVTNENWLVVTIVGATVDFDHLRSMGPNDLFSSVEVIGFKTSVQVTLKLKPEVKSCEVVHDQSDRDIAISLFNK